MSFDESKLEEFDVRSSLYRDANPFDTKWKLSVHDYSVRTIFSDADKVYSASVDKKICSTDLTTGRGVVSFSDAHDAPINKIISTEPGVANIGGLYSGDDNGCIKLWDLRAPSHSCVASFEHHIDYISDMHYMPKKHLLISTSGDGYLNVIDARKGIIKASSDGFETEIMNLAPIKNSKYFVGGLLDGSLSIFKYNFWAAPVDKFVGHPSSIDSMLPYNPPHSNLESVVITGGGDGIIRVISLLPNSFMGVAANTNIQIDKKGNYHIIDDRHQALPVSCLGLDLNGKWLASSSFHENVVYFWNDHLDIIHSKSREEPDGSSDDNAVATKSSKLIGISRRRKLSKQSRSVAPVPAKDSILSNID